MTAKQKIKALKRQRVLSQTTVNLNVRACLRAWLKRNKAETKPNVKANLPLATRHSTSSLCVEREKQTSTSLWYKT